MKGRPLSAMMVHLTSPSPQTSSPFASPVRDLVAEGRMAPLKSSLLGETDQDAPVSHITGNSSILLALRLVEVCRRGCSSPFGAERTNKESEGSFQQFPDLSTPG